VVKKESWILTFC